MLVILTFGFVNVSGYTLSANALCAPSQTELVLLSNNESTEEGISFHEASFVGKSNCDTRSFPFNSYSLLVYNKHISVKYRTESKEVHSLKNFHLFTQAKTIPQDSDDLADFI